MLSRIRFRLALLICPELGNTVLKLTAVAQEPYTARLWPTAWVPDWWYDVPVRTFILSSVGQMTPAECLRQGVAKFGDRMPPKTSLYRAFNVLRSQQAAA